MYNYKEVIDRIENSRRFGNLPGVEVTKRMLAVLNNPQEGLAFIHVAGTNGKGSTCAFLTNILTKAGRKCGCFTSPHLIHFEERITVGQQMIPKDAVTRLGNELLAIDFGVTPTMFDYCLVMAVLYFKECGCDVAVMETGLGGRLDSTNALGIPEVAVITRIGYDHMAILGNTLTEIASEKAGILKDGATAVFAPQEEEALAVLRKHPGILVSREDMAKVALMKPGLMGEYQLENGAAAMLAAQMYFNKIGMDEKKALQAIQSGIHTAVWKGRMEILSEEPYLMVDGAHNSNGIHALAESLRKLYPDEKFHFVMGVMADKDYEKMIEELLPLAIDFVTVTPESSRALQAESLAEKIRKHGIPARSVASVADVLELPCVGEKTIALGSLYFIGELEALYNNAMHKGKNRNMSYLYEQKKDRKGLEYIEITGYEGGVRHLVIPDTIEELPVRSIGKSAFSGREDLTSVELPETIEILGRYAFYNCKNLRTMCLYDGVEDYYDGVIKQCQSLSEITLYQKKNRYSVMKELLADNDRRLTFTIEPIGLRLTFPAYVYDFVEDVEARVLHHKIEGSGYPYRECVTRKGVDLLAYDKLFDHVISDDYEAAIMIALNRLRYPVELETAAREQYEQYLEQNARIVLQNLIGHTSDATGWRGSAPNVSSRKAGEVGNRAERDDSPVAELRYLCDECLIPKDALEEGLYEAADKKLSEITAILMEYQRQNFGAHQQQTRMTLDEW